MLDHPIEDDPALDRVSDEDRDKCVLDLMLCDSPGLWTVDEIARVLKTQVGAEDAVARLCAAGLVHRLGEFVTLTHAARRAVEIGAGSI
jgi:hypothetical protein